MAHAVIAVSADIDGEASGHHVDFIGANQEQRLHTGIAEQSIDAAVDGEAQPQCTSAGGGRVDEVEAVPAILDHTQLCGSGAGGGVEARCFQRAHAQDDCRALGRSKGSDHLGRQRGQQRRIVAKLGNREAQIRSRADIIGLGAALLDRLAQPNIEQRGFLTGIGADKQNGIGRLDTGQTGIEQPVRRFARIEQRTILAAFNAGRAQRCQKIAQRHHLFDGVQITHDAGNFVALQAIQAGGDGSERFGPRRLLQLAIHPHPRRIKPAFGEAIDGKAALVGQPFFIDVVVQARRHPQHSSAAAANNDVAANGIHHVDRIGLLQLPRPRLEGIGLGGERADRAQINHVARHFGGDGFFQI